MLLILYPIIFILASIVPQDFLTVAFDSGGVTTGPMTVPFIMALGIGFSAVRSDKHAENDSLVWLHCVQSDQFWQYCCLAYFTTQGEVDTNRQ